MGQHRRGERAGGVTRSAPGGLTLLHTATSHVGRFDALLAELAPDVPVRHAVNDHLLADARAKGGVDAALAHDLGAVVSSLAETASVILCTCSTLGEHAEARDGTAGARGLRRDRPRARAAVGRGSSIVVVAALASTLEPTRRLLEDEAARVGKRPTLTLSHCPDAWAHFERGDEAAYLQAVAAHVAEVQHRGDVMVLAQASMAGAEAFVRTVKPVLSSPRLGVLGALALL